MKYNIILALLLISARAQAQNPIMYTEVVHVDSTLSAKVLFDRARGWFAASFKDSKNVLEINDKESGELTGKGTVKVSCKVYGQYWPWGYLHFNISVRVKDGRYKIDIGPYENEYIPQSRNDFTTSAGILTDAVDANYQQTFASQKAKNQVWVQLKEQAQQNTDALVTSLKKAMMQNASKSDW